MTSNFSHLISFWLRPRTYKRSTSDYVTPLRLLMIVIFGATLTKEKPSPLACYKTNPSALTLNLSIRKGQTLPDIFRDIFLSYVVIRHVKDLVMDRNFTVL